MEIDAFHDVIQSSSRFVSPDWHILVVTRRSGEALPHVMQRGPLNLMLSSDELQTLLKPHQAANYHPQALPACDVTMARQRSTDENDPASDAEMGAVDEREDMRKVETMLMDNTDNGLHPDSNLSGTRSDDEDSLFGHYSDASDRKESELKAEPDLHRTLPCNEVQRTLIGSDGHRQFSSAYVNRTATRAEQLIETETLAKYRLKYNTLYGLIICTTCEGGIPLSFLHSHLKHRTRTLSSFNTAEDRWEDDTVVEHPHLEHPTKPGSRVLMRRIVQELNHTFDIDRAHIRDRSLVGRRGEFAWDMAPLPHQRGPIMGLRVYHRAFVCDACKHGALRLGTIEKHRVNAGHARARITRGPVQTLSIVHNTRKFFVIEE